jgi:hypothetical protein
MDVIRHQAVRVQGAAGLWQQLAQRGEINQVIGLMPEAVAAIVPALNNVDRDIRHDESGLPRHTRTTAEREFSLTRIGLRPRRVRAPSPNLGLRTWA